MKALLFERERLAGESRTGLVIKRDAKGDIVDIETVPDPSSATTTNGTFSRKGPPVMWIDLHQGRTQNGSEEIRLRIIKCPFQAWNSIRFYVDLCNNLDDDLFTNNDPGMPERFCQIVRRQLQDPQNRTSLRFIGTPKSYVDGSISSVDGVLTKDVKVDGRGKEFPIPRGESLPIDLATNKLIDRGEYEENYEDDFMIGLALGLPIDSPETNGMRLIRNDLAQLRLFDLKGRQLDEEEKNTYRLVITYGGRKHLIGNYAHFLRQDLIGTRIPHRLTLPLEEERFQVPPLSPDEVSVPQAPSSIPIVDKPGSEKTRGAPLGKGGLPLPDLRTLSLTDTSNPTGLEPQYIRRNPYGWAEEDYDLIVEEPRLSLDALTNKVGEGRGRERDPPGSPESSSSSPGSESPQKRNEKKSRITI
jgi:hypothetical protein